MRFFKNLFSNPNNTELILLKLIQMLNVKVTKKTIERELLSHPDFPSMLSLSDTLSLWKVSNMPIKLTSTEFLKDAPLPFIAHLDRPKEKFILVEKVDKEKILYFDSDEGKVTKSINEFNDSWSGNTLLVQSTAESGESNFIENRIVENLLTVKKFLLVLGPLVFLLISLLSIYKNTPTQFWGLFITKMLGVFISFLLIVADVNEENNFIKKICGLTKKTDCQKVLHSETAKLWGWLGWSEIGFLYFLGGFLSIVLIGYQPFLIQFLLLLSLCSLPYTVYSIYHQVKTIKQWCTLCLIVQIILWAEFILLLNVFSGLVAFTINDVKFIIIIFGTPILLYIFTKSLIVDAKEKNKYYFGFQVLKNDPNVFQSFLRRQTRLNNTIQYLSVGEIGFQTAHHVVTIITNPYCHPCSVAHNQIEELLRMNSNVKVRIVFLACDGINGDIGKVASHMMSLQESEKFEEALTDWFSQTKKDYNTWAQKWPVGPDILHAQKIVQHHCDWCHTAAIDSTPTVFVDNYLLPNFYQLSDLRLVLKSVELVEASY